MNEDIIRMAREAGWSQKDIDSLLYIVETAAAAEREACAKVCDSKARYWRERSNVPLLGYVAELEDCADAIRARGNT